ncbi:ectonucleoside triphosphate diphosphohydrolase 8-like isoform X2 [Myxocyprinus asiaticus]|uniref:ectonucleoside triphosphate diphosphohydrolase 8-like isoform X2 n=1 Tax=Myxocyprinus asiaticus TaxID=70543 RepID=UPI002221E416|nr:ectonucleoside triphosphate diphosphohydrolase 8-like isoform X2 [Myxocyprinus asiaticus]
MGVQMKPVLLGAAFAAVACTTFIALILSLANHHTLDLPHSTQYGIVFDAGSTHTALFLYQWLGSKENSTGIVSQSLSCDVDGDGISSYVQNPPGAGESLKKCLAVAKAAIPSGQQRATPVYLGATAGMRLLSLENKSQADIILAEVTKTIQSYPFDFRGARILTGMEEGAYGWITINYLFESFIKHTFEGKWVHPKAGRILGALDLGGASTQISFTLRDPVRVPESSFNPKLYGYKYEVYTHSYQCYGKDQALKKLQAWLHKAFSAYFYTFDFLGLAPKAPLNQVLSTIDTHCNKTWNTLVAQNPSIKAKYLRDYCASAHYIMTILLKGLKFNNTWDQISFEKQVADTAVGWTLGYMLNLTNLIPSEHSRAITGVSHNQWAAQTFFIVSALFLSLLIVILFLALKSCKLLYIVM